jgi:putative SOS response-associated peptidase YedK
MCTKYLSPDERVLEQYFRVKSPAGWHGAALYPRAPGVFLRPSRIAAQWDCVAGRWGLIPSFATTADIRYATYNARFEELLDKPSYRQPWLRGQRCLIPADSFDEPCWETGRNVWWRFRRRDGTPWALAGLWNAWLDRAHNQWIESYTMLTVNADDHPLMRRMHKPDPAYGPQEQDKRSVVAIAPEDYAAWLTGTLDEARGLVRAPPMEHLDSAPVRNAS